MCKYFTSKNSENNDNYTRQKCLQSGIGYITFALLIFFRAIYLIVPYSTACINKSNNVCCSLTET